jgi:SAM-dependent methyltransferase
VITLSVDLPLPLEEARAALFDELQGVEGVELEREASEGGTRATLTLAPELEPRELAGWFAALARAAGPEAYDDWFTDRVARRPSGPQAREVYADPLYHWPNFRAILKELQLSADDRLLEVGCGGGAFLHEALKSGCTAAAIDHSPDMVRLARRQNAAAIEAGRLEIVEGDAASLPFADERFTAAVMTGVLGFLPDPVAAFAEIRRVLAPGGRMIALGADPALKGTPAAPEPIASRLRFYTDEEHERIGRDAGLDDVRVERIGLGEFARESGVPEEALPLFEDSGTPFLLARRQ